MAGPGFGGFEIKIDLAPLERLAREMVQQPDPEILRQGTRETAEYVRDVWFSAVQGNMLPGMSRPVFDEKYAQALSTGEAIRLPSPWHAVVVCSYAGVWRIEHGYAPFDIKSGLLASAKAKHTVKEGRPYIDVPFRHGTPGGTAGTAPYGERVHLQTMPPHVYRSAKQLEPGERLRGGTFEWEGIRTKLPSMINVEAKRRFLAGEMTGHEYAHSIMPHPYTWKAGKYAGMVRLEHPYERRPQGLYMTFRRVSERSDPASWWYPGMPANPVIQAVVDASREEATRRMATWYCRAIGRPDLVDQIQIH